MVQRHQTFSTHIELIEGTGGGGKLLVLVFLAHEGLHHPDGRHVFLNALVQGVVLLKHLLEQARHARDDFPKRESQHQHGNDEDERQARVDDQAHHDGEQQAERRTNRNAQDLLEGLLQVLNVGGHAGDQTGGGKAVDVGEGKPLHVAIHRLAKVGGKTRRCHRRAAASQNAQRQADHGHDDHQASIAIDCLHVACIQAKVDQLCRDVGNQHVHHDLQSRKHRCEHRSPFVLTNLIVQRP